MANGEVLDAAVQHRLCLLAVDVLNEWIGLVGYEGLEMTWTPTALLRAVWSEN